MITSENKIINIYELFSIMTENEVILIYQGMFDQQMIKTVTNMTESKLDKEQVAESIRKKVFNIMIEALQNICKHQFAEGAPNQNPFMVISRNDEFYNIITGNVVHDSKKEILQNKIDQVNALDKEGLKELYKQVRLNSTISDVGGAGLGFIDMARKSENKLEYRFYSVNPEHSFFVMHSKVSNK